MGIRRLAAAAGACVLAAGAAACGGGGRPAAGGTLTIYSSLPVQGASRAQSEAVVAGQRLALEQFAPGGKLGRWKIRYVTLDDSTGRRSGAADERRSAQNARRAASDRTAVFYLGEAGSGGSTASIPILNRAGIAQIGPADTRVGLTTDEPGAGPGEPGRYRPTGIRTYARTVPRDTIQAAALVSVMKEDGCRKVTLWNDGTPYGAGLARSVEVSAARARLTIDGRRRPDPRARDPRSAAGGIDGDCFLWSGVSGEDGVRVYEAVAAACADCRLYGPAGGTEAAFGGPEPVSSRVGARMRTALPALGVEGLPRSRAVVARLKRRHPTRDVDPHAVYGYEAMALALDVLKRAGARADDRAAVVEKLFETRNRASVLGTYSIDANGDTSLRDYGLYTIEDGRPRYSRRIVPAGSLTPTDGGR